MYFFPYMNSIIGVKILLTKLEFIKYNFIDLLASVPMVESLRIC